jgi:hypothetical protein
LLGRFHFGAWPRALAIKVANKAAIKAAIKAPGSSL